MRANSPSNESILPAEGPIFLAREPILLVRKLLLLLLAKGSNFSRKREPILPAKGSNSPKRANSSGKRVQLCKESHFFRQKGPILLIREPLLPAKGSNSPKRANSSRFNSLSKRATVILPGKKANSPVGENYSRKVLKKKLHSFLILQYWLRWLHIITYIANTKI